jgi:hypothetical protein
MTRRFHWPTNLGFETWEVENTPQGVETGLIYVRSSLSSLLPLFSQTDSFLLPHPASPPSLPLHPYTEGLPCPVAAHIAWSLCRQASDNPNALCANLWRHGLDQLLLATFKSNLTFRLSCSSSKFCGLSSTLNFFIFKTTKGGGRYRVVFSTHKGIWLNIKNGVM